MSRMNRNNEPLFISFHVRLVMLLVSVVLILVGLLLADSLVIPGILLVVVGCFLAFFSAGGQKKLSRRSDLNKLRRRPDDVPLNPWDHLTGDEK